ncbi:MAG: AAA family ATPase [Acidimicrobiia bacterium]
MRLHSLSLTAFGSFPGTEQIDFDRLSDAGLFLLHGPTGAGKTTVLDAVAFALFGKVPGTRLASGLRSHHAAGATPTEVRLEVTLRSRRYRIMRQPRQLLPRQRGIGTREHAAKALVEELVDGAWVPRATRPTEADPLLQEHLHMAAEQFHQIVMLPQGDFARFLRASPEDRRAVLEKLFATQRFADVERWLRTEADAAESAIRGATEHVRRTLVAAATVAGAEPYPDDAPITDALRWLHELQVVASDRARATAATEAANLAALEAAKARHAAATEVLERQRRYATARRERATLTDELATQAERVAELDLARRAMPVLPLLAIADRGLEAVAGADRRVRTARGRLSAVAPGLADADGAGLAARIEAIVGQVAGVDALIDEERQLIAGEAAIADLDHSIGEAEVGVARFTERRTQLPVELREKRRAREVAHDAAQRVEVLAADCARSVEQRDAARLRDQLEVSLREQEVERAERIETARRTYEHWLGLISAQTSTQAARLATDLEPGAPCPVCGAHEHTKLATTGAELVSDEAVERARGGQERAGKAVNAANAARSQLAEQLAAARAIAGGRGVDELTSAHAAAERALCEAQAVAGRLTALDSEVQALEAEHATLGPHLDQLRGILEAARARRVAIDENLCGIRRRIDVERDCFATLTDRRDALLVERETVQATIAALATFADASRAASDAAAAALATSGAQGFADLDAVRAAARDDSTIVELEAAVRAHQKRVAEVDSELERAELIAAAALAPVDLSVHAVAVAVAEQAGRDAAAAADAARHAVGGLELRLAEVALGLEALVPLAADHEKIRGLADLASGEDRQVANRMRLSTYVLAARLEQVAIAASERLRRMSNDRYTIVHTDEEGDGRRKGGLGLRVVDAWTGTERETTSLSGGESFFTSLALALGVADVVASEAGGLHMETMFIDEGFGSLDDATLHDVMDVLDGLRVGGRAVGIVSHVTDLRNRVPAQVEVVKGARGGSSIRVIGA